MGRAFQLLCAAEVMDYFWRYIAECGADLLPMQFRSGPAAPDNCAASTPGRGSWPGEVAGIDPDSDRRYTQLFRLQRIISGGMTV